MDSINLLILLIPIVAIIGGFAVAITGILTGAKVRELKIRERIAMIEKGLVPPPEMDPAGFDRAMSRIDWHNRRREGRHRRAGIILMGVGVGLIVLQYVYVDAGGRESLGPGAFIAILGLAFLISSFFERRYEGPPPQPPRTPPLPPSTE